jgi:hypothetical protein
VQCGVVMAVNPRRVTWLKVNKKASGNRRSQRKRRSKLLLQRRVKRARRRVGSRRSDQARRNRNKRLAFDGGPFSFYAGRSIATGFEYFPISQVATLSSPYACHSDVTAQRVGVGPLCRQGLLDWEIVRNESRSCERIDCRVPVCGGGDRPP